MSAPPPDIADPSAELVKLRGRLERERAARAEAEAIAEGGLRELYRRQQELELLEKMAVTANESPSLESALPVVVRKICDFTGWICGNGYIVEAGAAGILKPATYWYARDKSGLQEFRSESEWVGPAGLGLPGRVLSTGAPAWIPDVRADSDFPRAASATAAGLKGGVAFPVLVKAEVVAVLEFFSDAVLLPDETLLKVVAQIGTHLGRLVERQRSEDQRLAYMAHHDALTDLANRTLFSERLQFALARVRRGDSFALLCLDLDRFKAVNDTLGHNCGDALLREVGIRLRGCVRDTDTIARLGGDEFAVIQVPAFEPAEAAALAGRIRTALSTPYNILGHHVVIDVSIGISMPVDGADADQIINNADIALYRAKEGRGRFRFFEPAMDAEIKARRELELDLARAVAENEFELHYQPIFDIALDAITSCEALIRWRHPRRGLIPPDMFIPIAQETGFMVQIGAWVLRQACTDAATWPSHIGVAVNVSPSQMTGLSFLQAVITALAESGLSPTRLEIEITEAVLMQNNETTLATLHSLRDLGIRVAMDDFGTGYSSLNYLRSFPFDKIKVDRSFINGLPGEDEARAIVQAIAAMASSLKIRTTAEGVETEAQLDNVKALGYSEIQGYLLSKPLHPTNLMRLLFDGEKDSVRVA